MKKVKGVKDEVNKLYEESQKIRKKIERGLTEDERLYVGVEVTNVSYAYERIIDRILESIRKGN